MRSRAGKWLVDKMATRDYLTGKLISEAPANPRRTAGPADPSATPASRRKRRGAGGCWKPLRHARADASVRPIFTKRIPAGGLLQRGTIRERFQSNWLFLRIQQLTKSAG